MFKPFLWMLFACLSFPLSFAATQLADLNLHQDAIINGFEVESDSPVAKSTVLVMSYDGGGGCTGTVIGRDLVVTAGHCLTEPETDDLASIDSLYVDFSDYYDGEESLPRETSIGAQNVRLHYAYDHTKVNAATNPNDVALIRLKKPIPSGYQPAKFLPKHLRIPLGAKVIAAGFGDRSFTTRSDDYQLLTFDFLVKKTPSSTTLVTLEATRYGGIGDGDSGGPAWVELKNGRQYFWGVASSSQESGWAQSCFENLADHRDWLVRAAASMGSTLRLP